MPTKKPQSIKYKRVLLKLSGETLVGKGKYGLDFRVVRKLAQELVALSNAGVELAIVMGGGNIFRGRNIPDDSIDRATADYMGMVGTIINAIALQAEMEKAGAVVRVQSALSVKEVAEDYIRRKAVSHLECGKVVIFAAGSGNPFFTTDTAAALRALEVNAEVLLKATTNVDGVYTGDPNKKGSTAKKLKQVSYQTALVKHLQVMDSTAFSLCHDNKLPTIVFKYTPGSLMKVVCGEAIGTLVS